MDNTALLSIDMQNDYFENGKFPLVGINAAAQNAGLVMARFRELEKHVIHIRHEILRTPTPFFAPNTEGAEIHASLAPQPNETVITKNFPNSFRDTALQSTLQERGIKNVVIIGAMSHFCIDATTRAASDMGYGCTVIHDACATRDLEFDGVQATAAQVHAGFMAGLAAGYGAVVSHKQFLAGLAS